MDIQIGDIVYRNSSRTWYIITDYSDGIIIANSIYNINSSLFFQYEPVITGHAIFGDFEISLNSIIRKNDEGKWAFVK